MDKEKKGNKDAQRRWVSNLGAAKRKTRTKQMDAEGLGRKLLLNPTGNPRENPEKQTVGTVTASHKMLTL